MMSLPQQAILVSLQPCSQACGGSSCSSACLPAKVEGSERGRSARRVISRLRFTLTLSHSRSPEASHLAHTPPTASRDSREGTACLASCCVGDCEFAGIAFLLCCCRKVSLPPSSVCVCLSLSSREPGDCSRKTKHEGRRREGSRLAAVRLVKACNRLPLLWLLLPPQRHPVETEREAVQSALSLSLCATLPTFLPLPTSYSVSLSPAFFLCTF